MLQTADKIWLERVASYRVSGMTARKWCEENQVKYNSFKNCVTKYTKMLSGYENIGVRLN